MARCGPHGRCTARYLGGGPAPASMACECDDGWFGPTCEANPCAGSPCGSAGKCVATGETTVRSAHRPVAATYSQSASPRTPLISLPGGARLPPASSPSPSPSHLMTLRRLPAFTPSSPCSSLACFPSRPSLVTSSCRCPDSARQVRGELQRLLPRRRSFIPLPHGSVQRRQEEAPALQQSRRMLVARARRGPSAVACCKTVWLVLAVLLLQKLRCAPNLAAARQL